MEGGLTCAASASQSITASYPLFFPGANPGSGKLGPFSTWVAGRHNSKRPLSVKALKSSNSSSRRTLSSHWDISARYPCGSITPSLSRLPSFEELDATNMLLRQRIVFLGSQIDAMTADFIISQLLFLDAEDQSKEIKLFIHCSGGSSTDAMGIYDAMKLCKADVSTICVGLAGSVAAFLLAAGSKGKRFCMPNGRVMIHQQLGAAGGKASDMGVRLREVNYSHTKIYKILSRITGKPLEQINADAKHDRYMSPWEAKEYGLIDEVIDDGKPGLVAPSTEPLPPPKSQLAGPWLASGRMDPRDVPSEHKLLQNGSVRSHPAEKDRDADGKPEVPPS